MLSLLFWILAILWLLGFSFHFGSSLVHLLLVAALLVLILKLATNHRRAA